MLLLALLLQQQSWIHAVPPWWQHQAAGGRRWCRRCRCHCRCSIRHNIAAVPPLHHYRRFGYHWSSAAALEHRRRGHLHLLRCNFKGHACCQLRQGR